MFPFGSVDCTQVPRLFRAASGFFCDEEGQDLSDYCLLIALVALVAAGILTHISGGLNNLWSTGNQHLNNAGTTVDANGLPGKK